MKQRRELSRFIEIIALVGLILYIAQSWRFVNAQNSIGDEGAYLYKGYVFARGDYHPFQEYAFWTNKAPLSFLIPGYIQLWFGPGLRVARYFALFLGVLMLVGVWLTVRRLGGIGWAAVAVWVFALSRGAVAIYSEALSQGLVACMLAWTFFFTLGDDRPLWQLVLGSVLSILIVMTRQNMIVVPALLVLYIFWQYGRRAGIWVLSTCAVVFLAFHIYYWPNIMQIWAPWMPRSLTPFLDSFRLPQRQELLFHMSVTSRLRSFAVGMRDNIFIFLGAASSLVLFPRRDHWKSVSHFKTAVFLGCMFFVLFLMHTWASIPTDYCVFCFSGYHMFYSTAGLLFVLVVFANGVDDSPVRRIFLVLVVLFFAANLGIAYQERWSDWLLDHLQVLRVNKLISSGKFVTVSLRNIFTYTFHITIADSQEQLASGLGGLLLGILLCIVAWMFYRFVLQRVSWNRFTALHAVLSCCLVAGTMFPMFVTARTAGQCSTNYLSYYETAGKTLAGLLPPGSQVYWRGSGIQLAFLLYTKDVKFFPPQIQAGGGRAEGDPQQLLRMGRYSQEIDRQWRESADIYLIWENNMTPEMRQFFNQPQYQRVPYDMGGLSQCEDALFIYRRTQ